MKLKSLGVQTDLFFRRFDGEVLEKESYIVIRTPKNPGYRWGNFLVFEHPPKADDLEKWKAIFAKEIGIPPHYNHFVFAWDNLQGEVGVIQPFIDAGFKLEKTSVMTAKSVNPPAKLNQKCMIRTFTNDDWQDWIELELAMNQANPADNRESDGGFRDYLKHKADEYQEMIEAGLGQWFGAYVDGCLASSLGLFVWEKLGRFQMVATHPEFRRLGLAGTLVFYAAQQGLTTMGAETLVMCADPNYVAINIYESVGFETTEHLVGVDWHEK
jgi:ribosomal protein S18 acetylase RimI-like enzyme